MTTVIVQQCHAQEDSSRRIETIAQFINDLRNGKSNPEVFRKYLSSHGDFSNDTVRSTANGFTDLLRASVQASKPGDVQIYSYTSHPETTERLKAIDDPANDAEPVPLEFTLDTTGHKSVDVDTDDVYVLKLPEERIFVLFNGQDKIITWFAVQWRHRVSLVGF
ncbi:MAG TPA: hypothetical protein VFE50_12620 [Cyclobacteriaceae bacterium]|nr:hypothetical protein [Cyclobacteriaceae bacterium]